MVKITRFLRQFWGQPLKTKDLAVWRATCTCCGVLQNAQPAKPTTRVNSCVQGVTGLGNRPSSQGQYQAIADSNGNHARNATVVPWGIRGVYSEYGVLPHTHSGCERLTTIIRRTCQRSDLGTRIKWVLTVLSGIALAWVAFRRVV